MNDYSCLVSPRRRMGISPVVYIMALLIAPAVFAASPEARQIVKGVYDQNSSRGTWMRANFETYDQQGHVKKKRFLYRRIGEIGNRKTLVVFTGPDEIRGVKLLSMDRQGAEPQQYIYTPATGRVRTVVPQDRAARFIGTDFTFEDVREHALDDFNYRLLADAEVIDGHKTYKIEASPVDPSRTQYQFIYYWIAQDMPVILFAEFYDAQGSKVRVLHASQLHRVAGIWGARHTEMTTVREGTRTLLSIDEVKLNVKIDETLFTPEGLSATVDQVLTDPPL